MKIFTPTLAGIVGAAQLSTACTLWHPASSTDVLLTGSSSWDLLWSVPLGALLGASLGWAFLRLRGRRDAWKEWRVSWFRATLCGFPVALFAPGMLGLSSTLAQMRQGFVVVYCLAWLCLGMGAQFERYLLLGETV